MEITLLCENSVGHSHARGCTAEWGFSAYIRTASSVLLFDAGHTTVYWNNAATLGIDLQSVQKIFVSHYHWDHLDGLFSHRFDDRKTLVLHPDVLEKIPVPSKEFLLAEFAVDPHTEAYEAAEGVFFLGQIPRVTRFEKGVYKNDPMRDDTALAVSTPSGTIVITGCSHSGICNICEHAKRVTGDRIRSVVGGFHLTERDGETVEKTVDYFRTERPDSLFPMHCVDFPTLARFHREFGFEKKGAGDSIVFDP